MQDRYMFNMLSAVFAGNERCGRLDGECSRCPACPLHMRVDEGFDDTVEDFCSICRQPFSASMFFCDLVSKHRVHTSCAMDMLRAQECSPLRCPICREGSLSRMTPACAAEMLMQSRVLHPMLSFQFPPQLEPLARQQFLRDGIRTLDTDLHAIFTVRNRLVAQLRMQEASAGVSNDALHAALLAGDPLELREQPPINWTDAAIALCLALIGAMFCIVTNMYIEREMPISALICAFATVVCLVSVCTWAATFAKRIYPAVVVATIFLPAAVCLVQYRHYYLLT